MSKKDLFIMAFRNLFRRKSRTILTIISVVIGTISIMLMLSFGLGIEQSQNSLLGNITEVNILTIKNNYRKEESPNEKNVFNKSYISKLGKIPHIKEVLPLESDHLNIRLDKEHTYLDSQGLYIIEDKYLNQYKNYLKSGRTLQKNDTAAVIFGSAVKIHDSKENKYGDRIGSKDREVNPSSDKFVVQYGYENKEKNVFEEDKENKVVKIPIKVVGVISNEEKSKDNKNKSSLAQAAISKKFIYTNVQTRNKMIQTAKIQGVTNEYEIPKTIEKNIKYNTIRVLVDDIDEIEKVQENIRKISKDVQISGDYSIINEFKKQTKIVQYILLGIGSIAFFVAAIGISNTMIMSIYERRKEIGTMKVIGASIQDVRNIFLTEAGLIGFIGGIFGTGVSMLISTLINTLASSRSPDVTDTITISYIPVTLAISALFFTFLVGVLSGYMPARKVTKLSAIEALRTS